MRLLRRSAAKSLSSTVRFASRASSRLKGSILNEPHGCPFAIDDRDFGMQKTGVVFVYFHSCGKQTPVQRECGVVLQAVFNLALQQHDHPHPALGPHVPAHE